MSGGDDPCFEGIGKGEKKPEGEDDEGLPGEQRQRKRKKRVLKVWPI